MKKLSEDKLEMIGHNILNLVTLDNNFDVAVYVDCVKGVFYVVFSGKFLLCIVVEILRG